MQQSPTCQVTSTTTTHIVNVTSLIDAAGAAGMPDAPQDFQVANREAGIEWVEGTKKVVRYHEQDVGFADKGSRAYGESKAPKHALVVLATGKVGKGQLQSMFLPLFKPLVRANTGAREHHVRAHCLSVVCLSMDFLAA